MRVVYGIVVTLVLLAASQPQASAQTCGSAPPCVYSAKDASCAKQAEPFRESMRSVVARVVRAAEAQALATVNTLKPGEYPDAGASREIGKGWKTTTAGEWVSGFFPGTLWQLHKLTGKGVWRQEAERWTAPLADKQRDWAPQHDFGFIYLPSFGEQYEVTKSDEARRQVLAAAEATAWSFNPATGSTRSYEGWQPDMATDEYQQIVIIDHLMNIDVLLQGAKMGGPRSWYDKGPQDWVDIALAHARAAAKNHVRPDGGTYQVVEYSPETGSVNKRYTYQGFGQNSTWARGQSWAMAGLSNVYLHTKEEDVLRSAQKVADHWLQLVDKQPGGPSWVPMWDFDAPYEKELDGPRDSSAAAVATLAFLQLSEAMAKTQAEAKSNITAAEAEAAGKRYLCAAINTLRALSTPAYMAQPPPVSAPIQKGRKATPSGGKGSIVGGPLLGRGTGFRLADSNVDVGLVYGDYYFLKAIETCRRIKGCMDA